MEGVLDIDIDVDINRHFWLSKGVFKVSSGTVEWYRRNYGTDFDDSEIASPDLVGIDGPVLERPYNKSSSIWFLC